MTAVPSTGDDRRPLAEIGERFSLSLRLSDEEVRAGAKAVHDLNPIHHELAAARAAGYPGLIASGAHTGSILMGMTATHFSKPAPDGRPRAALGLGFEIRFEAVVHSGDELAMQWTVQSIEWKASLRGHIVRSRGEIRTPRGVAISATAATLVREPPVRAAEHQETRQNAAK